MAEVQTATATAAEPSAPETSEGASPLLPDTDSLSLDDLDSADAGQPAKPAQPESSQAAVETPQTAATAQQADPEAIRRAELIAEHAQKLGIKPDDPNYAGVLKQLADKDLYIEKLKAGPPQEAKPADQLTDFEKKLLALRQPQQEQPPAQPPQPPQTAGHVADNGNLRLGDIGDPWTKPEDAYTALNEAWTQNDLRKVADVENAMFKRRAFEMVPGIVAEMLQGILGPEFLQSLPELTNSVQAQRAAADSQFAVAELKRKPGFTEMDKLWEPEGEGEIDVFGEKFPNTALNRIISQNQWITKIQPSNDPRLSRRDAEREAQMERFKAVYTIYQAEQAAKKSLDPTKAQQLVETGRKIEQRSNGEATRQGLNAGSGATSAQGQQPKAKSFVRELIERRRETQGLSLDDI